MTHKDGCTRLGLLPVTMCLMLVHGIVVEKHHCTILDAAAGPATLLLVIETPQYHHQQCDRLVLPVVGLKKPVHCHSLFQFLLC